ncbi:hypothetical protein ABT254_45670, partial [Streptomyces sp. NPDC001137]
TTDKVSLITDAPLSDLGKLLGTYPGAIEVKQERFELQSTRFNDTSPFSGGASITNGGATCTSGFAVHNRTRASDQYMVTAAHCFPNGNVVWSGRVGGPTLGVVRFRFNDNDFELIGNGSYTHNIYTGGTHDSTATHFIYTTRTARVGVKVCVSGQTTFNHCGHKITNDRFSISSPNSAFGISNGNGFLFARGGTNNPCYCNGQMTTHGDSGAPIYEPDTTDSGAMLVGLNHGAIGGQMIGVKVNAILNESGTALTT